MDASGHNGCIQLKVDSGERENNTIVKGYFEPFDHLTAMLASVQLKPNLEETNFSSWHVNVTESIILLHKQCTSQGPQNSRAWQ